MVALRRIMPTGMTSKEKDEKDDKREENNKNYEILSTWLCPQTCKSIEGGIPQKHHS